MLTTIGQELERVRVLGLRVEQTICAIAVRSSIDSALIAELQHLDAVIQHIAALRDFSEQLALQCDDAVEVDITPALQRVTLADVRGRLADENPNGGEEGWEIL
ncbi:hypothetical protein [Terricaulis sp.]|uniref:hypothetical protein n=1 Tax=Terricaulis sp. TaxID=2768686 RepID=UPI002AC75237|nr:hypothetical protein [Terricaulis sp.]MDZ4692286.1 hypothetical protein [Terricaulis sp.]